VKNRPERTLVIGLDAASWRVIRPLIASGRMPHLAALISAGVSAELESTFPPLTPAAWLSMVTGVHPGKHGVYGFTSVEPRTYEVKVANGHSSDRPALWDMFNRHDLRVGVLNFPSFYPPPVIDSFFVSGMASPDHGYTHPPELESDLSSDGYHIHPRFTCRRGREAAFFGEVRLLMDLRTRVAQQLMRKHDWTLFWIVFMGIDWGQHYLWEAGSDTPGSLVEALYAQIDEKIGLLLAEVDERTNVMIVSDHGMQPVDGFVHVNTLLREWGYLRLHPEEPIDRLRRRGLGILRSLGRRWPPSILPSLRHKTLRMVRPTIRNEFDAVHSLGRSIDWSRTVAFGHSFGGGICVNSRDRFAQGIVSADDYESLRQELISRLENLRHPATGVPIVDVAAGREVWFNGPYTSQAPDICFRTDGFRYVPYNDFYNPWFDVRDPRRRADHEPTGVLVLRGPLVQQGKTLAPKSVVDITPTILYLHGLPIFDDTDGRVMTDAFRDDVALPPQQIIPYASKATLGAQQAGSVDGVVEERLRALGYL
jgi:predicted AlkP superfamily phosphohydrolase/phosphomutase